MLAVFNPEISEEEINNALNNFLEYDFFNYINWNVKIHETIFSLLMILAIEKNSEVASNIINEICIKKALTNIDWNTKIEVIQYVQNMTPLLMLIKILWQGEQHQLARWANFVMSCVIQQVDIRQLDFSVCYEGKSALEGSVKNSVSGDLYRNNHT